MVNKVKLFDDIKQDRKILVESTLKNVVKKMFSLWKKSKFGNECFKIIADRNYRVSIFETTNEVAIYRNEEFLCDVTLPMQVAFNLTDVIRYSVKVDDSIWEV